MSNNHPLVALMTDFGMSDTYVGVMKGVLLSRCPAAHLVDLTHNIAPQAISQAAYLLRNVHRYFPPHTVFLTVVDPSVGTERRAVAFRTEHGTFVGPDNGVFSGVLLDLAPLDAVELLTPTDSSHTFHGRDVFAPAAADLAGGTALAALGKPLVKPLTRPPLLQPKIDGRLVAGEVVHIDHFGNLITNIGICRWSSETDLVLTVKDYGTLNFSQKVRITVRTREITGIRRTYGAALPNALLALINSDGFLEVAVNGGSAARVLQAKVGDAVDMRWGGGTGMLGGTGA